MRPILLPWIATTVVMAALMAQPFPAMARVHWSLSLGGGSRFALEPCWRASEVILQVRRLQQQLGAMLAETKKSGRFDQPPPVGAFPSWSRCQDLAQGSRPDYLLVRMNLAAVKAALAMATRGGNPDRYDRLDEGLPSGFSAEDWGREILRDLRWSGCPPARIKTVLSRERELLRGWLIEQRDDLNRDVVWAYHQWEQKRQARSLAERARSSWFLWLTLGCPKL